ncbi:MAG: sterol desaturase family protein [Acidimicrobiia bacterium]
MRGGRLIVALAVLFLLFVPLEKLFSSASRRCCGPTCSPISHTSPSTTSSSRSAASCSACCSLPFVWLRAFGLANALPFWVALVLAFAVGFLGNYVGHRLTHTVPFLWRFHAVHHSIEQMDWVASARLHPLDGAFNQACVVAPLFVLGYGGGAFAGAAAFLTLLALFQHANVRLRFPGVRWVVNTPEWHHWHHSIDPEARDKNFGLPVIDLLFGTAHLPTGRRPSGFGTHDPVPQDGCGSTRHRCLAGGPAESRARGRRGPVASGACCTT